jgi:hypothetical protein
MFRLSKKYSSRDTVPLNVGTDDKKGSYMIIASKDGKKRVLYFTIPSEWTYISK